MFCAYLIPTYIAKTLLFLAILLFFIPVVRFHLCTSIIFERSLGFLFFLPLSSFYRHFSSSGSNRSSEHPGLPPVSFHPSSFVEISSFTFTFLCIHPWIRKRERESVLLCLNQLASLRRKRISCFLITVETVNSPAGPRSLAFW